jgi:hypothetical protein
MFSLFISYLSTKEAWDSKKYMEKRKYPAQVFFKVFKVQKRQVSP